MSKIQDKFKKIKLVADKVSIKKIISLEKLSVAVIGLLLISQIVTGAVLAKVWIDVNKINNIINPKVIPPAKITSKDHIKGNSKAVVALLEYSDFECPFCKRFNPTMNLVYKDYGDKVMLVYRHFPLTAIHPTAQKRAVASECVFEQGGDEKFWEFVDKNFALDNFTYDDLPKIADELGLNVEQFNTCLNQDKYLDKINSQQQEGTKAGVTGTPGNYVINLKSGKIIQLKGAVPFDQVKQAIDTLLK